MDNPYIYEIRFEGHLTDQWADWFDGFVLTSPGNGQTLLSGRVADQAALHGILNKINRLGLLLILVAQFDDPSITNHCPMCGQYKGCIEET